MLELVLVEDWEDGLDGLIDVYKWICVLFMEVLGAKQSRQINKCLLKISHGK